MELKIQVSKSILSTLNQLYEMEQKLRKNGNCQNITKFFVSWCKKVA